MRPKQWRRGSFARPLWRKALDWLVAVCLLLALILLVARLDEFRSVTRSGAPTVNDGDSLTFAGERVRLWGIDAPELNQSCTIDAKPYACGKRARAALQAMVNAGKVDCRGSEHDKYGRLLAICRVGTIEINRAMVESGWAVAYGGYETAQSSARLAGKGLWAGEFERPRDWRDQGGHSPILKPDLIAGVGDWLRSLFSKLFQGG
ncbi:MAG: thermonuclease family protein [Rhizobiaceae bacterium]|nr:thermonuclease family protein [Rhizobiaceae bacterium]